MLKLMEDPDSFYKPGTRPSGHGIGTGFAKDNGGAIPSNLLQIANTESGGMYVAGCKLVGADRHPARFPAKLPEFFIRFLTEPGDVVLDIFGGSNTTGQVAEAEGRRWLSFEERLDYIAASVFRFLPKDTSPDSMKEAFSRIGSGETVTVEDYLDQSRLGFSEAAE
jgi:DNA modification methylase